MSNTRSVVPVRALVIALFTVTACLPTGTRGTESSTPPAEGGTSPVSGAVVASQTPSGPAPSPSFVAPTPTPAPTFALYTVAAGDSLNSIAKTYVTTARSVAFWNRARYPSLDPDSPGYAPGRLQVGWTLQLIPGLVYDEDTGAPVLPSGAVQAP